MVILKHTSKTLDDLLQQNLMNVDVVEALIDSLTEEANEGKRKSAPPPGGVPENEGDALNFLLGSIS